MKKRPCEQCRRTQAWEYSKELWDGTEILIWSGCCDQWVFRFTKKLEWKRPNQNW